ncbi:MAG: hypothetical protein EPN97_18405 [Alphaproteobacteria bacterium]|nr:MAG: hypothetical protein EPN97_18405 [Alphaproteobacteria bacterium]
MGFHRGRLRKAFAVAAIAIGFMAAPGFIPPAEAASSAGASAAAAGAAAAAAAAAAARRAADDRAMNAAITNPSDQNIQTLQSRGLVNRYTAPFVREAVGEMGVAPGTKPEQVTYAQRDALRTLLMNKWRLSYISAPSAQEAVGKGLDNSLAKYFEGCKNGFDGAAWNYDNAKNAEQCMKDQLWEKETKPALIKTAEVAGVVAGAGALIYAATRRRRQDGYSS